MIKYIALIFFIQNANAEYRVYQYSIKNNIATSENNAQLKIVKSTLNPVSYKAYHGGSLISVSLMRTWICPGHTAKKEVCPSPYEKMVYNDE